MSTTITTIEHATEQRLGTLRELAQRREDGVETWLLWDEATNETIVVVADERSGEVSRIAVAGEQALDCFYHPFVYAALAPTRD